MSPISLNGGEWRLWFFPQESTPVRRPADLDVHASIPAEVPGNVELDLARHGLLPQDLFRGDNILRLRAYEGHEWWYRRTFPTPPEAVGREAELVFHGVDCLASYWLNGEPFGESDNMLVEHRFSVTGGLRPGGDNTLVIRLRSPMWEAMNRAGTPRQARSWLPTNNESLWIRKAPHGFGWDIMPRAISAGLWRGVDLVVRESDEILDLYGHTLSASADRAALGIHYELRTSPERLAAASLRISGECGTSRFEVTRTVRSSLGIVHVEVPRPRLWWPLGYGEPDLYEVAVELVAEGCILARRHLRLGLRTVELERGGPSGGRPGPFLFRVNGAPILVKGSNWVPADAFHSRDAERIERHLALFVEAGCNMIRCWGGNVYEDHPFFDFCDRHGLLVWQDFSMACALYPQAPEFLEAIRREARAVVRKLRGHASLAVWCGDNECDENAFIVGFDPNANRLTREVLPQVLGEEDPYRPYVPSSPYYPPAAVAARDVHILPERHLWGPRDYCKSEFYRASRAAFVSEIGYHGCPNVSALRQFLDPAFLWPWQDNPQWITHASDPIGPEGPYAYRIKLMANQIGAVFGRIPNTLEEFALASQIVQAEAKKHFVETARLAKWARTGVIWWNMIDGWPQFSDAVVDYYYGRKLAFHYLRRVQQPFCLMVTEPEGGVVRVVAGNDSRQACAGAYRVWDAGSGETLMEGTFTAAANANAELGSLPVSAADRRLLLMSWTLDGVAGGNHYLLGQPPFELDWYRLRLPAIAELDGRFDPAGVAR